MKCKRCGTEMNREKVKDHSFIYRCPRCNAIIGKQGQDRTGYTSAYAEKMGKGRQK